MVLAEDDIAENIEQITEDTGDFLRGVTRIQTVIGLRTEWNVLSKTFKNYISVRLSPRPDKFYYIELEKGPRGDYPVVTLEYDPAINPDAWIARHYRDELHFEDLADPQLLIESRSALDELTRILNHLMWIGAHALDVGAMTVFLYAFREREDLMDMYEAVSGARMHATYYRPGGVYRDLPDRMPQYRESPWRKGAKLARFNAWREGSLLDYLEAFAKDFPARVDEYETLLTDNRIWKQRTVGIGVIPPEQALDLAPVAELEDIVGIAALLGAHRRLQ